MRRTTSDFLLSACALVVLLGALVAFDPRVRDHITTRMDTGRAASDIAAVSSQARTLSSVLVEVVRDQSRQNGPLMIFVVAATILTIFMVRT